jgi:hypothetical protein
VNVADVLSKLWTLATYGTLLHSDKSPYAVRRVAPRRNDNVVRHKDPCPAVTSTVRREYSINEDDLQEGATARAGQLVRFMVETTSRQTPSRRTISEHPPVSRPIS